MYRRIIFYVAFLIVFAFLINGCARTHYYNSKEVNDFKNYMLTNYKDIKSIDLSSLAANFTIKYELKCDISDVEREDIFAKTRVNIRKSDFVEAVNKEAGRKDFFSNVTVYFENPGRSSKYVYEAVPNSGLKIWIIQSNKTGKTSIERAYDD